MATVTVSANELYNDLTLKKAPQEREGKLWDHLQQLPLCGNCALISSLHCNISLSLCFSYNGACFADADDAIVSQNGSTGDRKLQSMGGTLIFLPLFVQSYIFGLRYCRMNVPTSEYIFESNAHYCFIMKYWRNWWQMLITKLVHYLTYSNI